ncbi:TALD3 protein, partial [Thinocorus orbignyianus]|nr:TALD3 protein [Thinocorus orbignyianus]
VFISQYAVGQKDAFRAVLKQKAQNAAVLKEEKVQLLGKASTETKGSADGEPRLALREVDPATTIAAATAATIATTAPLLKIQNELEAKVNSVSELLHKLQETDRQLQRVAKQQLNTKAQREKSRCHEGISELAKEMNTFMVQRIQHLEKLQEQQMNIQSHLISFAVSTGGFQHIPPPSSNLKAEQSGKPEQQFHTCRMPSCQEVHSSQCQSPGINTHKSPLKTPVPRRCAPEPVSKNVRNSKKENSGTEKENI